MIKRTNNRVSNIVAKIQFGTELCYFIRINQVGIDAKVLVDLIPPAGSSQCGIGVRKGQMAAFRVENVEVEIVAQRLIQAHRLIVEPNAFMCEVVGSDDCSVACGVAASKISLIQNGDVRNAVIFCKIIGGCQPMATGADNYDIVTGLERVRFFV